MSATSRAARLACVLGSAQLLMLACGGGAAGVGSGAGGDGTAGDGGRLEGGSLDGADLHTDSGSVPDGSSTLDASSVDAPTLLDGSPIVDVDADDAGSVDADADLDATALDAGADASSIDADAGDASPAACGVPNSIFETEPNETAGTATPMPPRVSGMSGICGTLSTVGDHDFIRFQLAPTATSLSVQWVGNITPVFTVGGVVVLIGAPGSFRTDLPYVVEITPNVGATPPLQWSFRISEN